MKARLAPALLVAAAFAVALAGCGGDGEQSESAQDAATVPQASVPDARDSPGEEREGNSRKQEGGEEFKGGEASIEEFGSEAEGGDREAILATFSGYLNALADEDYATACSHLSGAVHQSLEQIADEAAGGGCTAILPKLLAPSAARIAREQANGRITKIRVEGDRAFVVFQAPGAKLYQLTMVEEDGAWKATTVAASVLVPDL